MKKTHENKWSRGVNRTFSSSELRRFFSVIKNDKHLLCFKLQRYLGLRIGEAVRVKREDLNLEGSHPRIAIVNRKAEGCDAPPEFKDLAPEILGPLREYVKKHAPAIKKHEGYLIYSENSGKIGHVTETAMRSHFRRYVELAGIDDTYAELDAKKGQPTESGKRKLHRLTTHSLRHTYLTRAWQATKDVVIVQRLGRHKKLSSTQCYVHSSAEALREANRLACGDHNGESISARTIQIAQMLSKIMDS